MAVSFSKAFPAFLIVLLLVAPALADEGALGPLERSREGFGAAFPGKELLPEIKMDLLRADNAGAKRLLAKARGAYGPGPETASLNVLVDVMEHNYRGALASLGLLKADAALISEQEARFKKAERDSASLVREYGAAYATTVAMPQSFDEGVSLQDRHLFLYSSGGVLYRYDTRGGRKDVVARLEGGKTFGMTASCVPELTAVSVKTGGRYVIKVFSETNPDMAADLERRIGSSGSAITPFLSIDGQTFLFASDRSSSRGGFDIYLSTWSGGRWSNPQNAGSMINTSGNEINPWLHADSDTLFFSSNGRRGFGGYDIFAVKLSAGTAPVNLGMPINDIFDQSGPFSVDLSGRFIYLAAGGRVSRMPILYSMEMSPMRFVFGRVTMDGKAAGRPVIVKVDTNEGSYGAVESMPDGRYSLMVPFDREFILMPVCSGYLLHTEEIEARRGDYISGVDFNLTRIYRGMRMKYVISFDAGGSLIPEREKSKLKELVKMMKDNPQIRFEISGHSSGLGTHEAVERVSKLRVAAIMDYMLEGNVNPRRLEVKAYGSEKKLVNSGTMEAAQMNRRVEIDIVSWDEGLTALATDGVRSRLAGVRDELNLRRKLNFAIPGYALAGAALACFGAGGYYTYKSLDVKAQYGDVLDEYRSLPLASQKIQSEAAYQRKLDGLDSDFKKYRRYSIYSYIAGGSLAVASAIMFIGDFFNRATVKELEKEADSLMRVSFDVKLAPQATEFAFTFRF